MPDKEQGKRWMRAVVRLYPRPFRERFGDGFLQTFADLIDDAADQGRNVLLTTVACLYDTSIGAGREWSKLILTTMFKTETATRVAIVLLVPFVFLIGISLASGSVLNAQLLSLATIDGQQLNGVGRVLVFGSVLLVPISLVVNFGGLIRRNEGTLTFAPTALSVSLAVVQTITLLTICTWMITEAVSCSRGVCD